MICGDFIQLCLPLVDELKNEYCCLLLQILVDQCFYFYFVFVACLQMDLAPKTHFWFTEGDIRQNLQKHNLF